MIQISMFKKNSLSYNFAKFMKRPKSRHAMNNEQVLIVVFKNCLLDRYYYTQVPQKKSIKKKTFLM